MASSSGFGASVHPTTEERRIGECPAFKEGQCPFAAHQQQQQALVGKCPAFEGGCPFKAVATAGELRDALAHVPASHGREGTRARQALSQVLGAKDAAACPVLREMREWQGWWSAHTDDDEEEEDDDDKENNTTGVSSTVRGRKKTMDSSSRLSALLKSSTEKVHAEAENVDFVKALLERRAPLEAYVALVARLARVYDAMEAAMADAEKRGATFFLRELRRSPSLENDLQFLLQRLPDALLERLQRSAATDAYVARLDQIRATQQDDLLAAHAYTRYLGDLSGGQVLKRAVKRGLLHNADDGGLDFYTFATIGGPVQVKKFKDTYRRTLDATPVADVDAVVDEAVRSFRHNTALLAELDAFLPSSSSKLARTAAPTTTAASSSSSSAKGGTCPFLAGVDVSKLPPDAYRHHHAHFELAEKPKCPFHNVTKRDVLLVALLAAAFVALPYCL